MMSDLMYNEFNLYNDFSLYNDKKSINQKVNRTINHQYNKSSIQLINSTINQSTI